MSATRTGAATAKSDTDLWTVDDVADYFRLTHWTILTVRVRTFHASSGSRPTCRFRTRQRPPTFQATRPLGV